jgi:hypothetical protein
MTKYVGNPGGYVLDSSQDSDGPGTKPVPFGQYLMEGRVAELERRCGIYRARANELKAANDGLQSVLADERRDASRMQSRIAELEAALARLGGDVS